MGHDSIQTISLAILAGGKSDRMGQDKALMLFMGKPLIEHVIERLKPLAEEIFIVVNQPEGYKYLQLPLHPDIIPGCGSLGGIYTSLSVASSSLVAVVGCDMPFANLPLYEYERELLSLEKVDAAVPATPQGLEPLHAIYRRETCLPHIKSAIGAGERKIISWFNQANIRILSPEVTAGYTPDFQAFINLNAPDELKKAEQCYS